MAGQLVEATPSDRVVRQLSRRNRACRRRQHSRRISTRPGAEPPWPAAPKWCRARDRTSHRRRPPPPGDRRSSPLLQERAEWVKFITSSLSDAFQLLGCAHALPWAVRAGPCRPGLARTRALPWSFRRHHGAGRARRPGKRGHPLAAIPDERGACGAEGWRRSTLNARLKYGEARPDDERCVEQADCLLVDVAVMVARGERYGSSLSGGVI